MKKSRAFASMCVSALLLVSTPGQAAILQFDISGDSSSQFGAAQTLTGSFLFDTSTPLSGFITVDNSGTVLVSSFIVDGGISGFHTELDGGWSLDTSGTTAPYSTSSSAGSTPIGSQETTGSIDNGSWEGYFGISGMDSSFFLQNLMAFPDSSITNDEWMNSTDPVADFFLTRNALHGSWTVTNPDGSKILIAGLANVTVSAVPVPATSWLFCSGLLGFLGVARRTNRA